MRERSLFWAMMLAMTSLPASAEVVQMSATGFETTQSITIDKPINQVWPVLRNPQKWWSKEHTYSDDSANLYLDGQALGCFCERLADGGSIAHAQILYIQPPRMIRMTGGLGPLQAEAVTGTLTWALAREGESATRVTFTYIVAGTIRGGAEAIAPKVDEVLAVQLLGLKSAAESAPPPPKPPTTR